MLAAAPHRGTAHETLAHGDVLLGVANRPDHADAWLAGGDGLSAALSGSLDNEDELRKLAAEGAAPGDVNPAALVLTAFRTWGKRRRDGSGVVSRPPSSTGRPSGASATTSASGRSSTARRRACSSPRARASRSWRARASSAARTRAPSRTSSSGGWRSRGRRSRGSPGSRRVRSHAVVPGSPPGSGASGTLPGCSRRPASTTTR